MAVLVAADYEDVKFKILGTMKKKSAELLPRKDQAFGFQGCLGPQWTCVQRKAAEWLEAVLGTEITKL